MRNARPTARTLALTTVVLALAAFAGCGPQSFKITPVPTNENLEESVVLNEGGLFPPKIALIDVEGVLLDREVSSLFGHEINPVALFVAKLEKASKDSSVKAVILRINSPGGSVTASDLMHSEVLHFKEKTNGKRPVVAVLSDVAASGGYYVACSADEIVACPTTVTGSIGVIMQLFNFVGTMGKIGMQANAITSGKMKDAGSPFKELTPGDREMFQGLVNNFYDRFVKIVAEGRPKLTEARIRQLADGRVWSAQEAVDLGLVDRIASLRETLDAMKKKMGVKKIKVVEYHKPLTWKPNIYAETPGGPPQMNLINLTLPPTWAQPEPQFMYLWVP